MSTTSQFTSQYQGQSHSWPWFLSGIDVAASKIHAIYIA